MPSKRPLELTEQLPWPVMVVASDGLILAASQAVQAQVQWTPAELTSRRLSDFLIDPPTKLADYLRVCSRSRQPLPGSITIAGPEGQDIVCHCEGAVFEPANEDKQAQILLRLVNTEVAIGQFRFLQQKIEMMNHQLRSHRQIEEALRQSEQRFKLLMDGVKDYAIFMLDPQGRVMTWNAGAERLKGYDADEIIGEHLSRFYSQEAIENDLPTRALEIAEQQGRYEDEDWRVRKDGTRVCTHIIITALRDQTEALAGFAVVTRDLTERVCHQEALRERDERLRAIFEQTQAGIAQTDLGGRFLIANQRYCEIVGRSEQELLHLCMQEITHPDDLPGNLLLFKEAVISGKPFNIDKRYIRPDGTLVWVSNSVSLLRDRAGRPSGMIAATVDITERKRLEKLKEIDRNKTEFLANLGHELRNPLAPIRSGLDILKMAKDDPALTQSVHRTIERQIRQMVRLVDDLLDTSRIMCGKLQICMRPIALAEIMRSAVEASRPLIDDAGNTLTLSLPDHPILLNADLSRLTQVFSNLLNNAAKYTPRGGHIELSARQHDSHVEVTVKDDGLGIPVAMQERVFEIFTQVHRTVNDGSTGLGLGLALVKQLVEAHGGTVHVRSEGANQGSEFIVRLPILDSPLADAPQRVQPTRETTPAALRLLVVEDNVAAAEMLATTVRMMGHDVRIAYDGQQGVEMAADFRPDVVLMNLAMPKLDGWDAARHIRAQPWGKKIIIVAVTGWGQDEDKRRTREAGFDYHVVKPAESADLRRLLATVQSA